MDVNVAWRAYRPGKATGSSPGYRLCNSVVLLSGISGRDLVVMLLLRDPEAVGPRSSRSNLRIPEACLMISPERVVEVSLISRRLRCRGDETRSGKVSHSRRFEAPSPDQFRFKWAFHPVPSCPPRPYALAARSKRLSIPPIRPSPFPVGTLLIRDRL